MAVTKGLPEIEVELNIINYVTLTCHVILSSEALAKEEATLYRSDGEKRKRQGCQPSCPP